MNASVATLQSLAQLINANLIHLRDRSVVQQPHQTQQSNTAGDAPTATGPPAGGKKRTRRKSARNSGSNQTPANEGATENAEIQPAAPENAQPTPSTIGSDDWVVKDFLLRQAIGDRDFIDIR